MLWDSGDEGGGGGRLVNEVKRVGEGGSMLISVVDALTCLYYALLLNRKYVGFIHHYFGFT